jgi:transposase-like protein
MFGLYPDTHIAKKIGVSPSCIFRWRKKAGVEAWSRHPSSLRTLERLWLSTRENQYILKTWKRSPELAELISRIEDFKALIHVFKMERCLR